MYDITLYMYMYMYMYQSITYNSILKPLYMIII